MKNLIDQEHDRYPLVGIAKMVNHLSQAWASVSCLLFSILSVLLQSGFNWPLLRQTWQPISKMAPVILKQWRGLIYVTNKILQTWWCVASQEILFTKNCSFYLGSLSCSLGEASHHLVRTFKQHCGETMSGGINFQLELARHLNELCPKVDPPVPVKPHFESSAEAQRHGADISCPCFALSKFQIHKNNGIISCYCCFLPLSCGGDL